MNISRADRIFIAQCLLSRARKKTRDIQRLESKYPGQPLVGQIQKDIEQCARLALELQSIREPMCMDCGDLGYILQYELGRQLPGSAPCPRGCVPERSQHIEPLPRLGAEAWTIPTDALLELTQALEEHPEGWEWPCLCAECRRAA